MGQQPPHGIEPPEKKDPLQNVLFFLSKIKEIWILGFDGFHAPLRERSF